MRCTVDHGAKRYARVFNKRICKVQSIEVIEDHTTPVNWISPRLAENFGFKRFDADSDIAAADFGGVIHETREFVTITVVGKADKSLEITFYMAPEHAPIELVVGQKFKDEVGYAPHEVFLDNPVGATLVMVQQKITVCIQVFKKENNKRKC